eukprot:Blabericola_migrator_1__12081@NODE_743_length_6671_cov_113_057692_g533_i0_p3_GENE_NODE_743_length_6671_cov_113_057692_g533_i0NODE_743_length_6671_cov_113_057692_g533_i0_p3_ORF_typecomplete_len299_score39_82Tfb4/PF03850_14/1_2e338TM_micro/PF17028_5/0_22_NODE_743_length_6671_cov_113_057692_g533_i018692765
MPVPKEALAVVVDLTPWAFSVFNNTPRTSSWHPPTLNQYWNAVCEMLSQYRVLYAENTLVIVGAHCSATEILFRGTASDIDLDHVKEKAFTRLLPKVDNTGISLLTLAMSQSLCHLSLTRPNRTPEGRMLVIVCESTEKAHGVGRELLSLAFAAKALKVAVDLATVYPVCTPAWSQLCHETGGSYLNLVNTADVKTWSLNQRVTAELQKAPGKLFASLLAFFFLHPVSLRSQCAAYPTPPVDNVATCSCHNNRVLLGHVCIHCFSVYCEEGLKENGNTCTLCKHTDTNGGMEDRDVTT